MENAVARVGLLERRESRALGLVAFVRGLATVMEGVIVFLPGGGGESFSVFYIFPLLL